MKIGTKDKDIKREDLLVKAGQMVKVVYNIDDHACFGIGWFFAMDETSVRLKVTSTKFETYESIEIDIKDVVDITDYTRD